MNTSFLETLGYSLTPEQTKAVITSQGAFLVIAGAGSGKTRVITCRMAYLMMEKEVPGNFIVALTFTNKAAAEMRDRVRLLLGQRESYPFVGTFHSYCVHLLYQYGALCGITNFSIIDTEDQLQLIRRITKQYGVEKQYSAYQCLQAISHYKSRDGKEEMAGFSPQFFRQLYEAYEKEKERSFLYDFDDLMITVLKLLRTHELFKQKVTAKISHLLVDEYQDTNAVQHELLKELSLTSEGKMRLDSLCAVGDQDQSIYSWRGAVVANMDYFLKDFAPVTCIEMKENHRSARQILEAANAVIEKNPSRLSRSPLWSKREGKNKVLSVECSNSYQEAELIPLIARLVQEDKKSTCAVLYRTHHQSRLIEEALIRQGVSYTVVGGMRFYERKEIKDILAFLKLLANPKDSASFARIINVPPRGVGERTYTELCQYMLEHGHESFVEAVEAFAQLCPAQRRHGLLSFSSLFKEVTPFDDIRFICEFFLEKTRYEKYLEEEYEVLEAQDRKENIREFLSAVDAFSYRYKATSTNAEISPLSFFLAEILLMQEEAEKNKDPYALLLTTIHARKGAEDDVVIITGLEEGVLPSSKSLSCAAQIEEERRLMYVGITRARHHLIVTSVKERTLFNGPSFQKQSRFLKEMAEHVQSVCFDRVPLSQQKSIIQAWHAGKNVSATVRQEASRQPFSFKPSSRSTHFSSSSVVGQGVWKKYHAVRHALFGRGVILESELKEQGIYYVTVLFGDGSKKKLLSQFLELL